MEPGKRVPGLVSRCKMARVQKLLGTSYTAVSPKEEMFAVRVSRSGSSLDGYVVDGQS